MGRVLLVLLSLVFSVSAGAAAPCGKTIFNDTCAECHEADEFAGENQNKIAEDIGKIIAGETKHKKALKLDHEQVAAVAAYMATGK
jgi:mono/diheme cytochrome c family protein